MERRIREARPPRMRTIAEFDFARESKVAAQQIHEAARGDYIARAAADVNLNCRERAGLSVPIRAMRVGRLDLPRLRGHPEKHESAVGVDHGKRRQGQAAEVFG